MNEAASRGFDRQNFLSADYSDLLCYANARSAPYRPQDEPVHDNTSNAG